MTETTADATHDTADDAAAERRRLHRVTRIALMLLAAYGLAWVLGNGGIAAASWTSRALGNGGSAPAAVAGVPKFQAVDSGLWRGGRPTPTGYRGLAAAGVRTVVDLRAGDHVERSARIAARAGLTVVRIPIEDGSSPTAEDVRRFVDVVRSSPGPVFVHCNAGVGRTGSMVAAYLVATGQQKAGSALLRSLAVGPPSLEQVTYMVRLDRTRPVGVPGAVVAVSRMLDAPRHFWNSVKP